MRSLVLVAAALTACAAPPPYQCSSPIDMSGRGLALCRVATQTPVCDLPGEMAHYEMTPMGGYTLIGATTADCDASNQVVCADRTVLPRCIEQPVSP